MVTTTPRRTPPARVCNSDRSPLSPSTRNKRKSSSTHSPSALPVVFDKGTPVSRYFEATTLADGSATTAGWYDGEIVEVIEASQDYYLYHVVYDDGDQEDLDRKEVIQANKDYNRRHRTNNITKKTFRQSKLNFFKESESKEEQTVDTTVAPAIISEGLSTSDDSVNQRADTSPNRTETDPPTSTRRTSPRRISSVTYAELDDEETQVEEPPVKKPRGQSPNSKRANSKKPASARPQSLRTKSRKSYYDDDDEAEWDTAESDDDELEYEQEDEEDDDLDVTDDEEDEKPKRKRERSAGGSNSRPRKKKLDAPSSPAAPTWKVPSSNITWTKASVYDYEDEIPSDAEEEILAAVETCQVKVAVVRNSRGASTVPGKSKSSRDEKFDAPEDVGKHVKPLYMGGNNLPVLSHPQQMFDDMIQRLINLKDPFRLANLDKKNPAPVATKSEEVTNARKLLLPLVQTLLDRPLKVATMCSGTESPILALDMLQKSLEDICNRLGLDKEFARKSHDGPLLQIEHVFSCEIEPFKQAYIERNFRPPLLFRDIRELGQDEAYTAYGALAKVPNTPGDVDVLIAGTSCVDYSNLNNRKKTIDQKGESGQTFWGMVDWIDKTQPPIVIIENVNGAPWDAKVKIFEERGYTATFKRLDTKDYYIPHTRQRGYLFAVKKKKKIKGKDSCADQWQALLANLKRPASAALDDFMLSNDDPRVLRGRARLTAESYSNDEGDRAGRIDWTKCETRHQYARSNEDLGEKRPLTGWSDSGKTVLPAFAWNEWTNAQVHRIHDLMDINMLRLAKAGMDCTFKTMVWNLSQNVDRDTMGKLGLCQCLTPTGVPYVTNRGGPLVGEELLLLQGIPADDLLFTKESEANLKDLAGNAMSTTVVGAVTLCALLLGYDALSPGKGSSSNYECRSLVPRPLQQPSEVSIERILGEYQQVDIDLGPSGVDDWQQLLRDAHWSARKCYSEGPNESLPLHALVVCSECGETCGVEQANPPRRYEEHNYRPLNSVFSRKQPSAFKRELVNHLPMIVAIQGIDLDKVPMPKGVKESLWRDWKQHVQDAVVSPDGELHSFRFTRMERSRVWTAHYYSDASAARMEVRFHGVGSSGVTWFLYTKTPLDNGSLRSWLEKPVARLAVSWPQKQHPNLLTRGYWELCLPASRQCKLSIRGTGEVIDSWRNRLGLKGQFESERQFDKLEVSLDGEDRLSDLIDGTYRVLPKCGGACGSLMKKEDVSRNMFLFLESGRKTLAESDSFVFANTCHRTSNNEHREIELVVSQEFNPLFYGDGEKLDLRVDAATPGTWFDMNDSGLCTKERRGWRTSTAAVFPVGDPNLKVQVKRDGWKVCPEVVACTVSVTDTNKALSPCLRHECLELNMFKSKGILESLSFVTSRLWIPQELCLESNWVKLNRSELEQDDGDDSICDRCAPRRPHTQWTIVEKGNKRSYRPLEDGREAAIYEQQLKDRPPAWVVRLSTSEWPGLKLLRIGCNAVSLVQRAYGYFPRGSLVRNAALDFATTKDCRYDFRIVPHVDRTVVKFDRLAFSSNKLDPEAKQPPNFRKFGLRREQLRSLHWMLKQEESTEPFLEEEVTEEILPSLNWRAEGRVQRPVLVRGGIIADEVGYGKTAITLGLIDSAASHVPDPPKGPCEKLIPTKATLVIVPGHLMGQWPEEVKKFLENSKRTVVLEDMKSFNNTTVASITAADIVVVSFRVLCNETYFRRLARLVGINPESFPGGGKGGRLFDSVYSECLSNLPKRMNQIKQDCSSVFNEIETDAENRLLEESNGCVRLDGKKAVYKSDPKSSQHKPKATKLEGGEHNPWNFSSHMASYQRMKSPPVEAFFWNRIVVDEFTYLVDTERERVLSLLLGLKSTFRWCLSGTPQHSNFNDIKILGTLLGLHLGIDETLPGVKMSPGRGAQKASAEQTGLESLSQFLEVRSTQWHERRHKLAQSFMDRFVRQNVAEIDEIPSEEHIYRVHLPPAERAIYLELETHLKSLDMNSKTAQKSKKKSTGDRESRMQRILRESDSAEEALLKACSHYDMESSGNTASEQMEKIIDIRKKEMKLLERELIERLAACYRQHHLILRLQPDWNSATKVEKGEVASALNAYLTEVDEGRSVSHGADTEVHERLKQLAKLAESGFRTNPVQKDKQFSEVNEGLADEQQDASGSSGKKKKPLGLEDLYPLKKALHNYMHTIRALGKELCGRIRSLRFVKHVHKLQVAGMTFHCTNCSKGDFPVDGVAILTSCGHFGCLECLHSCATEGKCIEYPHCSADVSLPHVVSSTRLNLQVNDNVGAKYGRKLTAIVSKVKEIVDSGDKVIVFTQFDDLKDKVREALTDSNVKAQQLKGTVQQMVTALSAFQKEVPNKDAPSVLLLKMDDEQSAGLNLTNLNHTVFVHPLLAGSQQQYDAYETQAIGRIRRYGQKKTVHVHRFLVEDTIDTEIYNERGGRSLKDTTGVV